VTRYAAQHAVKQQSKTHDNQNLPVVWARTGATGSAVTVWRRNLPGGQI
jgi:hypothetical protein